MKNEKNANYEQALALYDKKEYKSAFKLFEKAARHGDADAQFFLGLMYYNGEGIKQDYSRAAVLFEKAAEQGDASAQFFLGAMYYNGDGVEQNYEKAAEWYTKAAEQGDADAQCFLGAMYHDGEGVEQDYNKAAEWYTKAAEQGDASAQFFLGIMYYDGEGVDQDYNRAAVLFEKAAEQGDAEAQCGLAEIYIEGTGVTKNYKYARSLYEKIIANKNADDETRGRAYYNLAGFYDGVEYRGEYENLFRAKEYYTLAKDCGYDCQTEIDVVESRLNIGAVATNKMGLFSKEIIEKALPLNELFPEIEKRLKDEFGEVWDTMLLQSKECLITGCLSYIALFSTGEDMYQHMDFSSAIVPIVKACEIEFGNVFFDKFLSYLKQNKIPPTEFNPSENKFVVSNVERKSKMEQYDQDEEYLYFRQRKGKGQSTVYYVDDDATGIFTLGAFRHYADIDRKPIQQLERLTYGKKVSSYKKDVKVRYEITVNRHMLNFLDKIFKKDAFPKGDRCSAIKEYIYHLANRLSDMAQKLRNPASHGEIMPYWKAIYCGNLVIMVEKILKGFLSKIKYD